MVGEHVVSKIGSRKYLVIDCKECANNASLGNPTCFKEIREKLKHEKNVSGLVFQKGFRRILSDDSFSMIKEFLNAVDSLGDILPSCGRCLDEFSLFKFKVDEDPIGAITHFASIRPCKDDESFFSGIAKQLGATRLFSKVIEGKDAHREAELYHTLFKSSVLPGFVSFYLESIPAEARIIESYEIDNAEVSIYTTEGSPYPKYHVRLKEFSLSTDEMSALNNAFDALKEEELDLAHSLSICMDVVQKVAPKLEKERQNYLANVLRRYSFGYSIIEILFRDPRLQDIYVDSPGDRPIYVYHSDYEECATNIILSPEEIEKLSTRFRLMSGRPFDESHPVLNAELKELGIRITGVTEPMTFSGTGFAFRKHAVQPWTLAKFVKNNMLSSEAAGLLSFIMDGQKSLLITGARGSGKTSLMGSLLFEIPQNLRIITIEDTPELPVDELRSVGYNMQHIRIRSTLQKESYEVDADEALRSALRLGESVLVIGEVRGQEARSLFEAMRIGAAGNVVMGTVHGSSAYDVWDRVVNDLSVPSTSFKAADLIVECAPVRKGDELRRSRRVVGLVEVGKHWSKEPSSEDGFTKLMDYDWKNDVLILSKDIKKSELIRSIANRKGMTMEEAMKSIRARAAIKEELVKLSKSRPEVLEIDFAVKCANKFIDLAQKFNGKVDYASLVSGFKAWLKKEG